VRFAEVGQTLAENAPAARHEVLAGPVAPLADTARADETVKTPANQDRLAEEESDGPAPASWGSFRLACLPFAYAILDGDTLGPVDMQPVIFQAAAGEHVLELANPRFPLYQKRFEVTPPDTLDLQMSLWETVARLTLHVKPWAEVFIDEVSCGKTPLDEIILAPGEHQLRLEHPERERFVTTRAFSAGQREMLAIELRPKE
jgi:hypothetical protein